MGIFNLGEIANPFTTKSISAIPKKQSFLKSLTTGLTSYEKAYNSYSPQNTTAKSGGSIQSFKATRNNLPLYIGGGGLALLAVYLIMK